MGPFRSRIPRLATLYATLFAALLTAWSCGSEPAPVVESPPPPKPAPVQQKEAAVKVVVLGDSISAGLGLPADQAFPAVVERTLKAEGLDVAVHNAGVSGDTSTAGAARVDWLLKQNPQILVVELGGNDLLRGQPIDLTKEKLTAIVKAGKAAGAEVILLGITAPTSVGTEHKQAFDALYTDIARAHGATLLPGFLDRLMQQPELIQADGLHPTAEGHVLLAETLAPVLRAKVRAQLQ
jgi:acyl-CoA thioesterase-1